MLREHLEGDAEIRLALAEPRSAGDELVCGLAHLSGEASRHRHGPLVCGRPLGGAHELERRLHPRQDCVATHVPPGGAFGRRLPRSWAGMDDGPTRVVAQTTGR